MASRRHEWVAASVLLHRGEPTSRGYRGHTGAGKTTITSLKMRFYDGAAGQVLVDGVDVRSRIWMRRPAAFGVGPAGPVLFSGTVADIQAGHREHSPTRTSGGRGAGEPDDFIRLPAGNMREPCAKAEPGCRRGRNRSQFCGALAHRAGHF